MTSFREAIFVQPENLAAAADAFDDAVSTADLEPFRAGVLVVGAMGASLSAAIPFVRRLRAAGRRAFLLGAGEVGRGLGDAFVLVSQSGASTETVDAIARLEGAPVLAVSAQGDSPVARAATGWLPLGPLPDTPVATLSYTATLQTLGMLGDRLLEDTALDGWRDVPDLAEGVLRSADPVAAELASAWAKVSVVDAVGGASGEASAHEAALLVREGLRLPATGMDTRSYLHGPMEAVAPGLGALVFGGARERELAAELNGYGATVAFVGHEPAPGAGVTSFVLGAVAPAAAPILEILPVQLLVDHVAARRGLPIGELRRSQPDTKVGR